MIGGRGRPGDRERIPEPIDYEAAVHDLLRRRRQRKLLGVFARIPDPRPASPGQVVLAGMAILFVGWLVPAIHVALVIGAVVIVIGFASGLIQPRGKRVVWRNRTIELPPERRWTDRLYHVLYRRSHKS